MRTFAQIIEDALEEVSELMPWDLEEALATDQPPLLIDIREPYEYSAMHISGSINVPRGILETACEFDFEETVPALASGRDQDVVVICRSGNRSVLAAKVMQEMGFSQVRSLKTGLRGWNDYEQPLVDAQNKAVDIDDADDYFTAKLRDDQLSKK